MKDRILVIVLFLVAVLALGVIVVFAFGTPQAPPSGDAVVATMSADSAGGETVIDDGQVPPPDPSSPLAIEIPGCVCHSDDPVLVEEHASYRMNQCFGCHSGGMPEMGQ